MTQIRKATAGDLPSIHGLIRESFSAMVDHYGEETRSLNEKLTQETIEVDLNEINFQAQYLDNPDCEIWVAVSKDDVIVGCIGVKKANDEESELVRMAVSSSQRNQGIGAKLIATLLAHCIDRKVKRVFLTTANPNSMRFYGREGFAVVEQKSVPFSPTVTFTVGRMVRYLGEKLIRKVVLIGGTHGNERVGVELVRQWARNGAVLQRPTVQASIALGNPQAVLTWQRYVDKDLNRQFEQGITESASVEGARARQLEHLLPAAGADFTIDMHSSTSNMGIMAVLCAGTNDLTALRLAHHLQQHVPELRIAIFPNTKKSSFSVDSITPSGISFEIGPLAHGCVSHTWIRITQQLVDLSLDFLHNRNALLIDEAAKAVEKAEGGVQCYDRQINHASDCASLEVVSVDLCPSLIPAAFPAVECFSVVTKLPYPSGDAPSPAKLNGSNADEDAALAMTPMAFVLHPDREGKDWQELEEGAPLFISLASDEVRHFKREEYLPKPAAAPMPWDDHDFPVIPAFINEAAYQRDATAMAIFKKIQVRVY